MIHFKKIRWKNLLSTGNAFTEIELNKILKEKGLTELEWDFKGLQDFYESFGFKQDFYVSKINNIKVISKSSIDNAFREVMKNVRKKISNSGLMSLSECMKFKEVNFNNIKKESVKKFVQTMPLFSWLDDQEEWFTFYSTRNRLSNLVSKAASVSNKTNFDNLYAKIKNHNRIENINYSKNIFFSFCKICFDCNLENENIFFSNSISKLSDYDGYKGNIVAPNEQKMVNIFKKFGPILNWSQIKEFSKKQNISEASMNMMFQFSVIFQRIDKATYILSGKSFEKNTKKVQIDIMSKSYKKIECVYLENESQYYVEVFKMGNYIKTIAYPQTLMKINENSKGILYENKVYPIKVI